jgi:hypothetical protein
MTAAVARGMMLGVGPGLFSVRKAVAEMRGKHRPWVTM